MVFFGTDEVTLVIFIGVLAAIVYSLRVLVLMERRVARMDENLEKITLRIATEEAKIEREEREIEKALKIKKKR